MKMYEVDHTGEQFKNREDAVECLIRRQNIGAGQLVEMLTQLVDQAGSRSPDLRVGYDYIMDCMDHCESMCEFNRQDMEPSLIDEHIIETEVDE